MKKLKRRGHNYRGLPPTGGPTLSHVEERNAQILEARKVLASRFRAARLSLGFTQQHLAQELTPVCGTVVTGPMISRWENSYVVPSRRIFPHYAKVLGVEPDGELRQLLHTSRQRLTTDIMKEAR